MKKFVLAVKIQAPSIFCDFFLFNFISVFIRLCLEWTFLCIKLRTEDGNKVLIKKKHRLRGVRHILNPMKAKFFSTTVKILIYFFPGKDIFGFNLPNMVTKFGYNLGFYGISCFMEDISPLLCSKPILPVWKTDF